VRPSVAIRSRVAGVNTVPILHLMRDGETVDTIVEAELEVPNVVFYSGGRRVGVKRPFSDAPIYEVLADGSGVVIVRRRAASTTRSEVFVVTKVGLAGDTVFERRFSYEPKAVSSELARAVAKGIRDDLGRRGEPPAESAILQGLRDGDHIPKMLPPVTAVGSGADGSIWLARKYDGQPVRIWDVLDRNGRQVATVQLGRDQEVKAFTGTILLVSDRDSLDVPYVIRYRVIKRANGEERTRKPPSTEDADRVSEAFSPCRPGCDTVPHRSSVQLRAEPYPVFVASVLSQRCSVLSRPDSLGADVPQNAGAHGIRQPGHRPGRRAHHLAHRQPASAPYRRPADRGDRALSFDEKSRH
jgi:hypothetical protein